MLSLSYAYLF
ncbi:hypothetical protein Zm00014a_018687 [Zea mays]|uniref:Uncharacterized protein n=1 Tax=Zea mays TaxID=4577 RepID=A0A3L6DEN7_MAIZE|nr:hypothetical protein Zm00014a_018687 [Zea mays]